jgi:hypothetical protein
MSEGWVQFLLVAVPVLSLVGCWLALRVAAGRKARAKDGNEDGARDG